MQITVRTALEIAHHEALVRQAYRDSVGVWTWSIGVTNSSGHSVERYIDNPQPLIRCLEVWLWVLDRYARRVRSAFDGFELTEPQFAAALSFDYNTGGITRATWVQLWKADDISGARRAFLNWRRPPEIIPRREKERDLFFDGIWSNRGTITEITRLTANYSPIFSSAIQIDIRNELDALLGRPALVESGKPISADANA
ncbi:lysozyme [Parasulfitobacter algicola]|uniref:Lysozyme n=1 Tax=Parasulfitobacter algicola TaxID=2614809 RepID=A0ABX2INU3_9RHOB|nr:hypothetical protein [Sulfitobacter algicola]NSX54557.1 hypothetical protein [Sulfitobacter algicola]